MEYYIWKGGHNPNLTAHHTSQVYSRYTDLNYDILYHKRVSRNLWEYMVRCNNKLSRRRFPIDNFIMERRTSLFHQNDTIIFLQCEKSDTIKSVYDVKKGHHQKRMRCQSLADIPIHFHQGSSQRGRLSRSSDRATPQRPGHI